MEAKEDELIEALEGSETVSFYCFVLDQIFNFAPMPITVS